MTGFHRLQEVLDLVRETGDRVVIFDTNGEPFMLMNLASDRSLLKEEVKVANLSEEEILEKVNRLIAAWKVSQPDLADYDLAQFRVDSIRQKDGELGIGNKGNQAQESRDSLLSRVIEEQPHLVQQVEQEDRYYPEPEI